jgi:hypothetical protein
LVMRASFTFDLLTAEFELLQNWLRG